MIRAARIPSIAREIEVMISEELSPQAQSRHLADFARGALKEAQDQNRAALGRVPDHRSFVDGRETEVLDTVRPDGRITFEFQLLDQVLEWIGEQLVQGSPVLSGLYARSHALFADGVEKEPGKMPADATEFVFINVLPYARKIERGLSPQAPDGVYEAVAAVAAGRFGNIAKIRFGFRAVLGGMAVSQRKAASSGGSWWLGHDGKAREATGAVEQEVAAQFGKTAHNKSNVRFPAIIVTVN